MLILARPHTSLLDGPAVAAYLKRISIRHAVFAVDPDYALHPVWSRILKTIGWITGGHTMLPLDSRRPFALRTIARMLDEGRTVVIFPQGVGLSKPDRPDAEGVKWLLTRQKIRVCREKTVTLIHDGWFPRVTDEDTPFRRYLNNKETRYG
jgi:1-acyl-sn-glycerol-3-phosphate acyltransferase